jgi:uncharacterized membrane protein
MTDTRSVLEDYLRRLERGLRHLPVQGRNDIVQEIREHIAGSSSRPVEELSEAELRTILDQVGDPEVIAEEARERFGVRRPKAGALEGFTIALLLFGGVILPIAGWLIGLVMLWSSRVWSTRDKIIGTVFVPGGLGLSLMLGAFAFNLSAGTTVCEMTPGGVEVCSGGAGTSAVGTLVLTVLVLAPIASAIYLGRRAFARR